MVEHDLRTGSEGVNPLVYRTQALCRLKQSLAAMCTPRPDRLFPLSEAQELARLSDHAQHILGVLHTVYPEDYLIATGVPRGLVGGIYLGEVGYGNVVPVERNKGSPGCGGVALGLEDINRFIYAERSRIVAEANCCLPPQLRDQVRQILIINQLWTSPST